MQKRVLSLALAAVLVLSLTACGSKNTDGSSSGSQEASVGVAVQAAEVTLNDISTENKVSGKVVADSEHTIMVGVSAKCTAVYVEAGDLVQAGEKICTLDLASTLASYNAANITYASAVQSYQDQTAIFDEQIRLAQNNVDNLKALFEIGAASQLEIDQAQLSLQQAIAGRASTLAQLEAGMQSYKSNVEQLTTVLQDVDAAGNVIAPASGTLVSLSAVENGYVSPSMPVAVIDGAEQMKVQVSVSEALVPKLSIGDQVDVAVSAAGQNFTGIIRSVEQAANVQTKLYTVTITVPADTSGLLSGMFADVTFHTDTSANTVVVPTEAILTNGNVQYVFVVENGDTARYVEVTTGLTGNGVTEVTSGLAAGEQLVTVGQSYLSDGDAVRVVSGED
ncbi:efflux RND transporter periplasmic adaptor subunit [Pseudoflavonifractor phocaeensis]|uniref:efflux RND transporter periplasmic adaptor subunit n=1 Tax=Pseudoflavonifractor phocaeensis TaxID=1870988 RepID=UPI001F3BC37E|nr:efflux RND transporter periplasmic adaptor subunit [Pseudoflavonifractor phocaeensis]MCF2661930.1 efflux RND transporter periplasmic adaptor subunit [Pseudoflavonifractor phocaeensis]